MMAPRAPVRRTAAPSIGTSVEAMAPQTESPFDPEAEHASLAAPLADRGAPRRLQRQCTRPAPPMLFGGDQSAEAEVRVVRYAVVPCSIDPTRSSACARASSRTGDEIQVVGASGAFLEVLCPNGDRGWVHRTTLGQRGGTGLSGDARGYDPPVTRTTH